MQSNTEKAKELLGELITRRQKAKNEYNLLNTLTIQQYHIVKRLTGKENT